jgi:hypothetical protein
VTAKEELHVLIDRLADEQAQDLLEDLRGAADVDGSPLNEEALGHRWTVVSPISLRIG